MVFLFALVASASALHDPNFHAGGVSGQLEVEASSLVIAKQNAELKAKLRLMQENQQLAAENAQMKSKLQEVSDVLEDFRGTSKEHRYVWSWSDDYGSDDEESDEEAAAKKKRPQSRISYLDLR